MLSSLCLRYSHPETDADIVETVDTTQHCYAAGLAVTKVRQLIASNNCVVTKQMTKPLPVTSHVAEHFHNPSETEAPPAPVIPAPCAVPARPAPAGTDV